MEALIPVISGVLAFLLTFFITPRIIDKMLSSGMTGRDVNKRNGQKVAEMGGIAVVFGFVMATSIAIGIAKLLGTMSATVILAVISVLLISAFIGILDDITQLSHKQKAIFVAFASIPLVLTHPGAPSIPLPGGYVVPLPAYFYWLVIIPLAITGAANALNMSAGYNGLETGQVVVISAFMALIAAIKGANLPTMMTYLSLFGASLALYHYNRYPARTFVGDVGTLSMGAVIGAGTIIGGLQIYGFILIIPTFFELISTIYHGRKGINRREACMNPVILDDGRLKAPEGTKWYTLAYNILSRRPMREDELVNCMLLLYVVCGVLAVLLALL